jgi:hypothetical protein
MITAGVLLFIVAVGDNGLALAVIRSDETLRPTPQTPRSGTLHLLAALRLGVAAPSTSQGS